MQEALAYLHERRAEHLGWAKELCRIPSISTQEQHKSDMRRAAEWVRDLCVTIGCDAEIHQTAGHPVVYAACCHAAGAPTYLAYGHLDVQPAGDLSLWDAGPFEPVVKDGWLFCRGAADNKGPLLVYLRAVQAWLETAGKLPINLKLLFEGEEEIGSPNLTEFVTQHKRLLDCDGVLISDTSMFQDGWPTITCGTRGICYKEVRLSGPKFDLHSGGHGGPVVNPANALARIIAALHDKQGRVAIPGFYDDVVEPTPEEREQMAALPRDEQQYAADLGVPGFAGEQGWSVEELRSVRPTCDVNGIYGGYTDPGASTVIPALAGAKISMRLVPNQVAEDVGRKFEHAVRSRCPGGVRCEILDHAMAQPYVAPRAWPAMPVAERALREAFEHEVAFIREGGSLPILTLFKQELDADSLLMGLASPNCNAHGPNEKVSIADLDHGAAAVVRLLAHLSG
ncbi:MAG: dipeptidase [Planctomycetes bacterium]|nr:dipeptidase [Planctomycetota bacterium]